MGTVGWRGHPSTDHPRSGPGMETSLHGKREEIYEMYCDISSPDGRANMFICNKTPDDDDDDATANKIKQKYIHIMVKYNREILIL